MEATVEVSSLFSSHHGVHGTSQLVNCAVALVCTSAEQRGQRAKKPASCGQWQLRDHVRFAMLLLVANSFFCRSHAGGSKADAGLAAASSRGTR